MIRKQLKSANSQKNTHNKNDSNRKPEWFQTVIYIQLKHSKNSSFTWEK